MLKTEEALFLGFKIEEGASNISAEELSQRILDAYLILSKNRDFEFGDCLQSIKEFEETQKPFSLQSYLKFLPGFLEKTGYKDWCSIPFKLRPLVSDSHIQMSSEEYTHLRKKFITELRKIIIN